MAEPTIHLTERQLRSIVKEAVHETLTTLGVDAQNPLEMQQDFQHLRDWRKTTDTFKRDGFRIILKLALTGVASLVALYVIGINLWPKP